jgi:4-amino-4-deoxy-L-arabinose transferase-like glycosyltransferase
MASLVETWRRRPALLVALAIAALVVIRIGVVILSPLELGPDEAQYWRWSRTLDWGYYSKPPLIAWGIAAVTAVFGDSEWAVRLLSPIAHGFAAWFLFLLGRRAFDARIGAWSAAIYLLMPGIWLSSTIMSTDAVLLPMWAMALYFLWRLRDQPTAMNAGLAGAAIGLAMLAKYAALYLYAGAFLAALLDKQMRKAIFSLNGLIVLVASLIVLGPNLAWNAANNFATVSHTADNANLGEASFNPMHVFVFLTDQMAVFGPLLLVVLLLGFALLVRRSGDAETNTRETWLLCFIIPPLLVIAAQAVISRAHANWAATAYPAACVLVASWIARPRWSWSIKAGVALNTIIGTAVAIAWLAPGIGDAVGGTNAYKRVRGWEHTTDEIARIASEHNATALMFDEREIWHGVDYYGRNIPGLPPVRSWRRLDAPRSHAEEAGAIRPGEDGRVLVASYRSDFRPRIRADFTSIEPLGTLVIPLGPIKTRELKLYLASGWHPLPRTPAYEAIYKDQDEP